MFRAIATKPKIPFKLPYDSKGEILVLSWPGLSKFLKIFSLFTPGYLYFIHQFNKETLFGRIAKYTIPIMSITSGFIFYKFSKFLHKMILLKGGDFVKLEKYPMTGWGHFPKIHIHVSSIDSLIAYGGKRWYNPYRFGRGYFKLKFNSTIFGFSKMDYVIFRIPGEYERDILKIIAIGKQVNERSYYQATNNKN
ncbi:hypothetical protein SteCoe_25673 [Stentor coeruleus]|uniref:Uncharacterized protein n=1 Tax=Stentor coeruleus TaxID=5963 RepID=A0A1R2BEN2_9CILI|nr:hypothetical protein SteCoe_25673 [Stentor coeruleus]